MVIQIRGKLRWLVGIAGEDAQEGQEDTRNAVMHRGPFIWLASSW